MNSKTATSKSKPTIYGAVAGATLLGFYFVLLSFANSREHAIEQFLGMWYWILALTFGFAIQVGLFTYARSYMKGRSRAGATAELAGTGTVSTGSMVACCAHHLSDVLPLLGISAALVFLDKYQFFLVVLGLLSNLVGITIMLGVIQKNNLYHEHGVLAKILKGDMKRMRNATIAVSLLILAVVFFGSCMNQGYTSPGKEAGAPPPIISTTVAPAPPPNTATGKPTISPPPQISSPAASDTPLADTATGKPVTSPPVSAPPVKPLQVTPQTNNQAGISIQVAPDPISPGKPLTFKVSIETHSGSLSFSLTKVALLQDNNGNEYLPQDWRGDPPGGHHVSGTLIFPPLKEPPQSLTLVLKDIGGVRERKFVWN